VSFAEVVVPEYTAHESFVGSDVDAKVESKMSMVELK